MFVTVKSNTNFTLAQLKSKGATIKVATTKNGYKAVQIENNGHRFVAIAVKNFEGEISLNTFVFEGVNAKEEPRLYLTNSEGGLKVGAEL